MINSKSRHLFRRMALSAAMLLSVAPASLANSPSSSPAAAQEHHACAAVMGLDPSEAPYDACVGSLDRSLSQSDQAGLARAPDRVGQEMNIAVR
jgi:hypothetical protein